jgi:hypothetical protein
LVKIRIVQCQCFHTHLFRTELIFCPQSLDALAGRNLTPASSVWGL